MMWPKQRRNGAKKFSSTFPIILPMMMKMIMMKISTIQMGMETTRTRKEAANGGASGRD